MPEKAYVSSPFGCFEIVGSAKGIRRVQLIETPTCPDLPVPDCLRDCVEQLQAYFERKRTHFDLKFDWSGAPPFHVAVWRELLKIPYGHTTSYSAIAEQLGDPKSVRAVGQANKNNPIAIIVPCHRVIAKNGDLQGYFYGLDVKRKLLELENPMSFGTQGQLF
ncbi:MAG: methylated-DNA--[protein]-cysteine S-methyltransferase [Bacteroidetes bacterium]|nr:MAG: methylated-DNA--[protein]-cysteine S-methyltransferase [Bacteroidota bacterium]